MWTELTVDQYPARRCTYTSSMITKPPQVVDFAAGFLVLLLERLIVPGRARADGVVPSQCTWTTTKTFTHISTGQARPAQLSLVWQKLTVTATAVAVRRHYSVKIENKIKSRKWLFCCCGTTTSSIFQAGGWQRALLLHNRAETVAAQQSRQKWGNPHTNKGVTTVHCVLLTHGYTTSLLLLLSLLLLSPAHHHRGFLRAVNGNSSTYYATKTTTKLGWRVGK